eukprot:gb/GFBE01022469.1/.p1 GENE.gb/GFBE01022469.1/~~gb/GFBE01022469.1/.p1  ORF type:complete len:518 (+),score=88.59 gb/GFBE01022469.1/:1-1554(+)
MTNGREVLPPTPDDGFFVAVPSYGRSKVISSKTLALLKRQGVPPHRVYVFVASEEEFSLYEREIGHEWPNIVIGVPKLWCQRNFITRFFAEGTHILSMDDDVEELYQCKATGHESVEVQGKLVPLAAGGLAAIASDAVRRMKHCGAHLWSFNVSDNPFFMRLKHVTKSNGLCNGFFWGCLNRHSEDLILQFGDGHEDVERTVRYYQKDGAVLRYRFFCAKTRCKTNAGGLQASMTARQRKTEEDKSAAKLVEEFPHLLALAPGSILGLKFRYGLQGLLVRSSVLSKTQLKELTAQRRLHLLEGSFWGAIVKGGEEDGHLEGQLRCRGGVVERCTQDWICLRTWEPSSEGALLGASSSKFYAQLASEELQVLWLPEAACEALGVSQLAWSTELDRLLRPWRQASASGSDCQSGPFTPLRRMRRKTSAATAAVVPSEPSSCSSSSTHAPSGSGSHSPGSDASAPSERPLGSTNGQADGQPARSHDGGTTCHNSPGKRPVPGLTSPRSNLLKRARTTTLE